ncbi:MAG: UvrB/UvrC motif-containing protein [Candidatus Woesearchaeota archaeon]
MKFLKRAEKLKGTVIIATRIFDNIYHGIYSTTDNALVKKMAANIDIEKNAKDLVAKIKEKYPNASIQNTFYSANVICSDNTLYSVNEDVIDTQLLRPSSHLYLTESLSCLSAYLTLCKKNDSNQPVDFNLNQTIDKTILSIGFDPVKYLRRIFVEPMSYASRIGNEDMFNNIKKALLKFGEKEPYTKLFQGLSDVLLYDRDNHDLINLYLTQTRAIKNQEFELAAKIRDRLHILTT